MHKNYLKTILLGLLVSSFLMSCDSKKVITASETPAEITQFVNTHFPNQKIIQSMVEQDDFKKTYEVILNDQTELEFNRKKEIISVDGNTSALPDLVIPAKIKNYVDTNFPEMAITDWKLEGRSQEIKLANGLELKFSQQGDFIRIDD